MKKAIAIIAVIFLLLNSNSIYSQEVYFLFDGSYSGENREQQVLSKSFNDVFIIDVNQAIQEEFPCARIALLQDVSRYCLPELELQRNPAFGDQKVDERKNKLLTHLNNSDYWVSFCFYPISEEMAIASLKCSDKKGKKLVSFAIETTYGDLILNHPSQAVTKFIKELSKYEICPYTGTMNFEVKTERNDKTTDAYPVYCNGADKQYKKEFEINEKSLEIWKLTKTDKYLPEGSLSYTLREESLTTELNECYLCPSGRKGSRVYTEKIIQTANIEGLSIESVSKGKNIPDARTEITFLEDGTYILEVMAASKTGDLKIKTETHAEGTCDVINKPPVTITKKADVPLNVKLGPFPGSGMDKILSQNGSYTTENPVTKEKTTVTYNFNLKRD
jgi:hypothetical protein